MKDLFAIYFQDTKTEFSEGIYISKKPNYGGIDGVPLNCDCNNGSFVNGIRRPFLKSFAYVKPPGHKLIKERRIIFEKINISIFL